MSDVRNATPLGSVDLQEAYDNSAGIPHIVVDAVRGGVTIRDAAAPIGADLFDVQDNAGNTLFASGVAQNSIGVDTYPLTDNLIDIGNPNGTLRFRSMMGRLGLFIGGTTPPTITTPVANPFAGGLMAGSQRNIGTELHDGSGGYFPMVITAGNTYNGGAGGTARIRNLAGGGILLATAASSFANAGYVAATGYGNVTMGYAWAFRGAANIINNASGSFIGGYPVGATGGSATIRGFGGAPGCFLWGRPTGTSGTQQIYARGAGSFVVGFATTAAGGSISLIQSTAGGDGSFVQGYVNSAANFDGTLQASGKGSFAQGFVLSNSLVNAGIFSSGPGTMAAGYAKNSTITASGAGAFAHGYSFTGRNILASGGGSIALGFAGNAHIIASGPNATQFGPGTNAVTESVQVSSGFLAMGTGQHRGIVGAVNLNVGVVTFICRTQSAIVTGALGGNIIATITGGLAGQFYALQFVDALVTITDDNTHAANTVDLSGAFVSAQDTILFLFFDGTSWYEVSRSVN